MKLKKIASLALAGIMAVSMLAGCKYGEGSSSSSSSSEATVTSSDSAAFAAALNDERTDYAKNIGLTYKTSDSLDEIVKALAADKYGKKSYDLETEIGSNKYAVADTMTKDGDFAADISDKLVGGISTWNANSIPTPVGDYKYALVYTVGGAYTAEEAAHSIAILTGTGNVEGVNSRENGTYMPVANDTEAKATLRAAYSAEVSAVKMTSNAHTDLSMWIVVVVYTQTVTAK